MFGAEPLVPDAAVFRRNPDDVITHNDLDPYFRTASA